MSDLKQYARGSKLALTAQQINAWTNASRVIQQGGHKSHSSRKPKQRRFLAKNGTTVDVPAYSVLLIDGPLADASLEYNRYRSQIAVNGVLPDSQSATGVFITQRFLAPGEIDENPVFSGITFARLDGETGKSHGKATASETFLEASDDGVAVIIYDPGPADSERLAIVRIDGGGGGGGECTCPEVHEFSTNEVTTGGSFTAAYYGEDVTWNWDATAAEVQTEFEGHTDFDVGEVIVEGGPWPDVALYVTFTVSGLTNVSFPTLDNTSLTGNGVMRRFSKGT